MAVYYKENISGLVDEIMADWAEYLPGQYDAHSQVFYDEEDGAFWHEMNMMNTWAEYPHSYSIVEIANITRPDGFPEYFDMARDEVESAVRDGMRNQGI